ncbi:hypothetical protein SanaruYs_06240 [Chryseotalea sanaruensis]|uniref:Alginate export domain-containing protein n=1 Tax=Chryseotalea sanaruensis TaxID=2482724 RepID=A0A401U6A6_9BACT|nr:hypothetical protein [Chryseotalea sanaruensis]GCC50409.1 hypothetical protein SanaruYs_06240 [Chryseotalea sanaruensis]
MKATLMLVCVSLLSLSYINIILAQNNDSITIERKWQVRGYLKDIQSLTFDRNYDSLTTGNLIHNRLNIKWQATKEIRAAAEFRTRLFWGEEIRLIPNFSTLIRNNHEAVNMSIFWIEEESMVLQTNIDRLWLEYTAEKWEVRFGRQRINWGIGTLWNPNDIFNTYNFLDFDYEERPGRDAMKFRYHVSGMSNFEMAIAASERIGNSVAAIKYFTNVSNYDFQFSAGIYQEMATIGMGWSGSVNEAGFKGELQYFARNKSNKEQLNAVLEADYVFERGWYTNIGILINSTGTDKSLVNWNLINFQSSPQNLMPTKWNVAAIISKEITPLLSGNFSLIYAPGTDLVFALPAIKYNLAANIDFDLVWQSFFIGQTNGFNSIMHRVYLRLKWNF